VELVCGLYFFDSRDNETFIEDDVGLDYPDLDAVKVEAAARLPSSLVK
jgi:hypothetical protein